MSSTISVILTAGEGGRTPVKVDDLSVTLKEVDAQLCPGDRVVLVVDHDPALLAECRGRWGDMVIASTAEPGLRGAEATGLTTATGTDVTLVLDPDCTPSDRWLSSVRRHFDDPSATSLVGAVEPRWLGRGAPRWLPAELGWVVGCDYAGMPADGAPVTGVSGSRASRTGTDARPVRNTAVVVQRTVEPPTLLTVLRRSAHRGRAAESGGWVHLLLAAYDNLTPPRRDRWSLARVAVLLAAAVAGRLGAATPRNS